MANVWTVFGSSNKVKHRGYRVTGPEDTEEKVREHMAAHYPHFQISSVHPGRLDKEPPASASSLATSDQDNQE